MRSTDLLKGMNDIEDRFIEEAAPRAKISVFKKYYVPAGIAAAIFVVFLSARALNVSNNTAKMSDAAAPMAETADMAPAAEESYKGEAADIAPAAEEAESFSTDAEESFEAEAEDDSMEEAAEESEMAEEAPLGAGTQAAGSADTRKKQQESSNAKDSISIAEERSVNETLKPDMDIGEADSLQIPNPWKKITSGEVEKIAGRGFDVPADAKDVSYRILESESLAEMDLTISGKSVSARMKSVGDFEDISGAYYDWTETKDIQIGGRDGIIYLYKSGGEEAGLCLYSDGKVMYSLFVTGKTDEEELKKLAEDIWN